MLQIVSSYDKKIFVALELRGFFTDCRQRTPCTHCTYVVKSSTPPLPGVYPTLGTKKTNLETNSTLHLTPLWKSNNAITLNSTIESLSVTLTRFEHLSVSRGSLCGRSSLDITKTTHGLFSTMIIPLRKVINKMPASTYVTSKHVTT